MYKHFIKPLLFKLDPEFVHDSLMIIGNLFSTFSVSRTIISKAFCYSHKSLEKEYFGIKFKNPVGLAVGFDYDAKLVKLMPSIGFGFATVGTVTNYPYEGNTKPRLKRLPKSQSLLVNKGFKSAGVDAVMKKLQDPYLKNITFGVSVGSSNIPQIDTIAKAVSDYVECLKKLEQSPYIKYYELNISCPNTSLTESFMTLENFATLLSAVTDIHLTRPIFIKMPNEGSLEVMDVVVDHAFQHGYTAFIFSNLVKDRANPHLDAKELAAIKDLKGNLSGKPTTANANKLIKHYRKKYGSAVTLVGVGGIFTPEDALEKFESGADLVQLITGMIYEGPGLIKKINKSLSFKS